MGFISGSILSVSNISPPHQMTAAMNGGMNGGMRGTFAGVKLQEGSGTSRLCVASVVGTWTVCS